MQHLFGHAGEAALAATMARRPLLAFDFDGTLTPIVARPDDARLSLAVSTRLAALAARLPLAIVTGRRLDDVRGRLGFEPRFIVGNHGAEPDDMPAGGALASAALAALRQRLQDNRAELVGAGISVEDKGISLALHYRLSRTRARALQVIAGLLRDHDPELRVFGGKLVVNVVPVHSPDKAEAVRRLLQRCGAGCAFFAGDDINDEPVFQRAPPQWLTVRVGPAEGRTQARFSLRSPAEVALLLARLAGDGGPPRAENPNDPRASPRPP